MPSDPGKKGADNRNSGWMFALFALMALILSFSLFLLEPAERVQELPYTEIKQMIRDGEVSGALLEEYAITVTAANASNFTATATYQFGEPESTKCRVFTIDGRGNKTSSPHDDCWTRSR